MCQAFFRRRAELGCASCQACSSPDSPRRLPCCRRDCGPVTSVIGGNRAEAGAEVDQTCNEAEANPAITSCTARIQWWLGYLARRLNATIEFLVHQYRICKLELTQGLADTSKADSKRKNSRVRKVVRAHAFGDGQPAAVECDHDSHFRLQWIVCNARQFLPA